MSEPVSATSDVDNPGDAPAHAPRREDHCNVPVETPATAAASTAPPEPGCDETHEQAAAEPIATLVETAAGLTRGDLRFLAVTGALLLGLSGVHWALLSGFGQREIEVHRLPERRFEFQVDVNRATWVEWMQLEGIGELTARKIVADREQRGPFRSVDEVVRVPGIGVKTLARIRDYLTCPEADAATALAADVDAQDGR